MEELVSIIVPVYNVSEYLDECIESLIDQSYNNLEIILVDDGSNDGSETICDRYSAMDARVKVVHKKNEGVSIARNCGIEIAKGSFLTFVDGDDYIDRDTVKISVESLKTQKADIVEYCVVGKREKQDDVLIVDRMEIVARYVSSEYQYPNDAVWNKMYRASLVKQYRFPANKIHEEYLFLSMVLVNAQKYVFINRELYYYRARRESTTHRKFQINDLDKLENYKARTQYLKKEANDRVVRLAIIEEFIILFSLYWKLEKCKMPEANDLKRELKLRKKEFQASKIPRKRKIVYSSFYLHPRCYLFIRDMIETLCKR